jgi:hypothetical protein
VVVCTSSGANGSSAMRDGSRAPGAGNPFTRTV